MHATFLAFPESRKCQSSSAHGSPVLSQAVLNPMCLCVRWVGGSDTKRHNPWSHGGASSLRYGKVASLVSDLMLSK